MTSIILLKIAGVVGVGAVGGYFVHDQLKRNEKTAPHAKQGALLVAVLSAAVFATYKFYFGT